MEGDQRVQVRDVMVHSSRDGRYPGQWCTYTPAHAPLCTRSMHRRARPCTRVCAPTARAGTSRCESVYPFMCSRVDVQLCSRVSTYPCDRVSREMHTWTRMHVYSVWFARSLPRSVGTVAPRFLRSTLCLLGSPIKSVSLSYFSPRSVDHVPFRLIEVLAIRSEYPSEVGGEFPKDSRDGDDARFTDPSREFPRDASRLEK